MNNFHREAGIYPASISWFRGRGSPVGGNIYFWHDQPRRKDKMEQGRKFCGSYGGASPNFMKNF
jgi:hypothetical protein